MLAEKGGKVTVGDASGNVAKVVNTSTGTYDITDDSGVGRGTFDLVDDSPTPACSRRRVGTGTSTVSVSYHRHGNGDGGDGNAGLLRPDDELRRGADRRGDDRDRRRQRDHQSGATVSVAKLTESGAVHVAGDQREPRLFGSLQSKTAARSISPAATR